MYRVNVYEVRGYERGPVIARVQYNELLDYWNGSNLGNGGVGLHLGITQLRDGRYILIHGTQWEGERDWAEVVTDEEALQAILKSGNEQLLEQTRFRRLKELAAKKLIPELV